MSIIYNNTEIENITYNGNSIDTVNYNNTEVFSGTKTLTVNKGSYITSIIINGTTYSSNTTLSIKPGTSVTLNCNLNNTAHSDTGWLGQTSEVIGNVRYQTRYTWTYSFVNWTGYTTNTNKSFTFTMPNQDITYTANAKENASSSQINRQTYQYEKIELCDVPNFAWFTDNANYDGTITRNTGNYANGAKFQEIYRTTTKTASDVFKNVTSYYIYDVEWYIKVLIYLKNPSLNLKDCIESLFFEAKNSDNIVDSIFEFVSYETSSKRANDFSTETGRNSRGKNLIYTCNMSQDTNIFRKAGTYSYYCTIYLTPGYTVLDTFYSIYTDYYGGYIKCRGTNKAWVAS